MQFTCYEIEERTYPEEVFCGSGIKGSVEDISLFGEIVGGFDRRQHTLDGEERGEVGSVRRNDDEREEPPRTADDPTG